MPMSISFICAKVTAAGILMLAPVTDAKTCDPAAAPTFQTNTKVIAPAPAAMPDLLVQVLGHPYEPPQLAVGQPGQPDFRPGSRGSPAKWIADLRLSCDGGFANTFVVTMKRGDDWTRATLQCERP